MPPTVVAAPDYSPLFYLWHLEKIGLIRRGAANPAPEIWKDGLPAVRVAIIDSGCASLHPNLPASAIQSALDTAVSSKGVAFTDPSAATIANRQNLPAVIEALLSGQTDPIASAIKARAGAFAATPIRVVEASNPAELFSGHGTACAGLVAARALDPGPAGAAVTEEHAVLPYFGANPYAVIIPITTPFSAEIEPVISALFHALAENADVILMPRAVNDLWKTSDTVPGISDDLRGTRFDADKKLAEDKMIFEQLLKLISADRPVIVAAGNDGRDEPAYPASLVASIAGALIVVGAMNHLGFRSSYSSGTYNTGVTVYAPSDDAEVIDKRVQRYDEIAGEGEAVRDSILFGRAESNQFSPFGVLAIDPPGRMAGQLDYGAGASARPLPTELLYSEFGGTSAASSILAGVVSLMQAAAIKAGKSRLTGTQIKDLFETPRWRPAEPPLIGNNAGLFINAPALIAAAQAP